jgi:hypothetical protein
MMKLITEINLFNPLLNHRFAQQSSLSITGLVEWIQSTLLNLGHQPSVVVIEDLLLRVELILLGDESIGPLRVVLVVLDGLNESENKRRYWEITTLS